MSATNDKIYDPYRPTYHFTIDANGMPGDPNGAFFAGGEYHLMYLYHNGDTRAYHWGHVASSDLIHWRKLPDALAGHEGDEGAYSGGAFVDDDGTAYLTFWKFPSKKHGGDAGGIALASSKPPYEKWERIEPIAIQSCRDVWGLTDVTVNGEIHRVGCSDPSNIWKNNGYYYVQTGGLPILIREARELGLYPNLSGDFTDLFRSVDLKNWEYVGRFYKNDHSDPDWPDLTEDDMCPSFLPLFDAKENGKFTGKYLQLFLSHNKGAHYYIGELDGQRFLPESHARMSHSVCPWLDPDMWGKVHWNDLGFFAPEALIDAKNRQVIWAWLRDNLDGDYEKYGWSGVYSLPRTAWLQDGELHFSPASELETLQRNEHTPQITEIGEIAVTNGETFRLKATFDTSRGEHLGFSLRATADADSRADVYYDAENEVLVFEIIGCGAYGNSFTEKAPLRLKDGEPLVLDILVDRSVIEVFANERQAISRRVYPTDPDASGRVLLIGDRDQLTKITVCDMAPIEVE